MDPSEGWVHNARGSVGTAPAVRRLAVELAAQHLFESASYPNRDAAQHSAVGSLVEELRTKLAGSEELLGVSVALGIVGGGFVRSLAAASGKRKLLYCVRIFVNE